MTPWRYGSFLAALGLFVGGIILSSATFDAGVRVAGAGMVALALWLQRYDLARRTVRKTGLTRFIAVALLAGYAWLFVGGMLALRFGGVMAGPAYDAMLHAVFVGFVISMVFGHAPVIFPALLRVSLPYSYLLPTLAAAAPVAAGAHRRRCARFVHAPAQRWAAECRGACAVSAEHGAPCPAWCRPHRECAPPGDACTTFAERAPHAAIASWV
jgi:hypothetical protein